MKSHNRILILVMLVTVLAAPGSVWAQDGQPEDQVVLGGNYTLSAGQSVGNLNVFGGNAVLEAGATVTDHVFLYGGNLTVDGEVKEDIHMYGGQVTLGNSAVVGGDITVSGGNLSMADGAQVSGTINRAAGLPFGIQVPDTQVITLPRYLDSVDPFIRQGLWFITQTIGLALLAMLVALFAPKVTERAGDAALARPLAAGGVGLIVAIVTPALLIGFAITIVGIPLTIVLAALAGLLLTFGWIALGMEVGKRLALALHGSWPAVVSAGLGTLLLSLVANGIGLTPCIGWIVPTLIGFVGMGGVLLTRFGTQPYPAAQPPAMPVAAA
jgi:hypothetical protein